MATYFFETITAAQALGFNAFAATDTLVFTNPTSSGHLTTVLYNAATATSAATVTVIDNADGRSVTFNNNIQGLGGATSVFPDGSTMFIGKVGIADNFTGTAGGDGLFGGNEVDPVTGLDVAGDTLIGGSGADLIQGNRGDDSLNGGSGNDTIFGGQGNDNIDAGTGNNFVQGNLGNDTIVAGASTASANTLLGGQGNDLITGGLGNDILSGDLGNDTLSGHGGNDSLAGVGGNDVIVGDIGNDTIDGGDGNDNITDLGGNNTIGGGAGNDTIVVTQNATVGVPLESSFIQGGMGNDTITVHGILANETILGGQGDDTINVDFVGNATIDGNLGTNIIATTALASGKLTITSEGTNDTIDTHLSAGVSVLSTNVTLGAGNATISDGTGADTITGGAGGDTITDLGGTNLFSMGNAAKLSLTVTGATGSDTVTSSGGGLDLITHTTSTGNDVININSAASVVTLGNASIGNSVTTGAGFDTVVSGSGFDTISTGGGNDFINGGAGNDVINGGAGDDVIVGGPGTDTLFGGGGQDIFAFSFNDSNGVAGAIDQIRDWTGGVNFLHFGSTASLTQIQTDIANHTNAGTNLNYLETTATDFNDAINQANAHLGSGKFVAVQIGGDTVVFADDNNAGNTGASDGHITSADSAVVLVGRTLADIDFSSII
jgi:Ca2+-binding RTX toxin-like protein